MPIIDTNVHLSRWPFRRLRLDDPAKLVAHLRANGITEAWAGTYDALLHRDLTAANERLVAECDRHDLLKPVGAINLSLPDWQEDVRRCLDVHRMLAIRVYPNYHGYRLDDPRFKELADITAKAKVPLQIAVMMEEERTQHPLVAVPHVDTSPLLELLPQIPNARVILQNAFRAVRGGLLLKLVATRQVWFDHSTIEGMEGLRTVFKQIPADRLVFGSHAPFYLLESALLKLKESALTDAERTALTHRNAAAMCRE